MYQPKIDPRWTKEHEGFYRTYDFTDIVEALNTLIAWWEAGKDKGIVPLESEAVCYRLMFQDYALLLAADFRENKIYASLPAARIFYKDIGEQHIKVFEEIPEITPKN